MISLDIANEFKHGYLDEGGRRGEGNINTWQLETVDFQSEPNKIPRRRAAEYFILTGSANLEERVKPHSGAGRFSVIRMRPMSLYERGWSTGEVSLSALVKGDLPKSDPVDFGLDDFVEKLTLGAGWAFWKPVDARCCPSSPTK
ncbi:MAG: hypothetical protein FWB78_06155 [Treponema sp.]|nr:hypothetical protein [Treponema sp.]